MIGQRYVFILALAIYSQKNEKISEKNAASYWHHRKWYYKQMLCKRWLVPEKSGKFAV